MPKPLLLLIYQDCYDCEHSKAWHEQVKMDAAEAGVLIKYTPHNTPGAKKMILEAHECGIEVPFLTDGKNYSRKMSDLVSAPVAEESTKEKSKKHEAIPKKK